MSENLDNNSPAVDAETVPQLGKVQSRILLGAVLVREPLWVIFCMFGLALFVVVALMKLVPSLSLFSTTTVGEMALNAVIYGLAVFFVLLPMFIRKVKWEKVSELLGLRKRLSLKMVGWALSAFAIYFWVTILVSYLAGLIPGFDSEQAQTIGFDDITTTTDYVMAFVGLVVLPPIFEELLFRGYLFGRVRKYAGFWLTTIVTSLAFGFVHGQWNVGLDTFVLSFFLCFLREHTGAIWAPMILHGLKNGLAYFFLFITPLLGFNLLQ